MFKKSTLMVCLSWSCLMVAAPAMAQDDADCMTDPDGNTVCTDTPGDPVEPGDPSQCDVDADCSNGFTCQVVGGYDCAVPPPGADGEPSPGEPCMSGEIKMCVPPPPAACDPSKGSVDCEGGLVCVTYTFEECSGSGRTPSPDGAPTCDPDGDECTNETQPEPPSCQSRAESVCVPKYLAPCQADADCGGGFKCVAEEICTDDCLAPSPGDGDGNEPDPACQSTCTPSSQKYCELQQVTCSSDADCAQGLSCEEFSYGGGEVCTVSDGDDGSEPVCSSEPATSESYCVPPDWQRWYGDSGADYDAPTSSPRDALEKSTGNGWKIVDAENAASPSTQEDASADGGCQSTGMGQSGSTAALSLLSLFGLIGWRRRKRA